MLETMPRLSEINEMRAAVSSPEKAGVGGSTPSLATIIPKNLAEILWQGTGKITHGRSPTPTG